MISLDATTLSSYLAASTADARAQAVIDSLSGTVYVRVYDGSNTLMGEGTMAAPWATRSGSVITVAEVATFGVLVTGTPDASGWYLRFEDGYGHWVRGPFGPGGNFTWSAASWTSGQGGQIGTVTLNARGTIALVGAAIGQAAAGAGLTVSGGGGGLLFSDGFETGDVSTSQNGFSWGSLYDATPAGGKVSVSAARAKSGSRSLEFFYKANTYQSEQRFYFAAGHRHDQIWIKYDLFLPTNYAHSDTEGGNNKFLVVQSTNGSSLYLNFSLYAGTVTGVLARVNLHWYVDGIEQTPLGVANLFFDGTGGLNGGVDDRGRWHRLVARFRANNQQTGIAELWKNGSQIINQTGLTASSTTDNIHEGYFLGWANSRYAQDTYFYIDDVEVSTQAITP